VCGARMLARSQVTLRAHDGGVADDVTEDQVGSPERLWGISVFRPLGVRVSRST
jgi:hypothetical protein